MPLALPGTGLPACELRHAVAEPYRYAADVVRLIQA
jgi:hypothetical protein